MHDSMIKLARELTASGYAVFPIASILEKTPARGCRWRSESTTEPAALAALAARYPDAEGWAIDCGKSGVVVVDLDEGPKHGRLRAGRAAWRELGEVEPATATATPSGGRHLFYAEPRRAVVGTDSTGRVALDVDVKGLGGYVVAYALPPLVCNLPDLPVVVVERMRRAAGDSVGPGGTAGGTGVADPFSGPARGFSREEAAVYVGAALDRLRGAQPGGRNHVLNATALLCGHFVPAFWPEAAVAERLTAIGEAVGLGAAEIRATVRSGLMAGMREPYEMRGGGDAAPAEDQGGGGDAADALIAEMLNTDELDAIGDLQPLVKGWLSRNSVARINGKSTHGKSFVTLDIAAHVGAGMDWRGARVHQGLVVYVVAEGAEGFRKRVRAWEKWHDARMDGVRFLPRPVQVTGTEWTTLMEACRRLSPALIVLDTQARVTTGVNENDNTEMGVVIGHAEALRRATGACVLFVHHLGHNGEEGRGATAVKAGIQTELLVRREGQKIEVTTPKQKDDADDVKLDFLMHVMEMGKDEDGLPITSCVMIEPGSALVAYDVFEDSKMPALQKMISLFTAPRGPFATGNGGTKAEVRSIAAERGMSKTVFYDTWNEMIQRRLLARVEGTQSYRYVPIEDRMSE